jgi:uncharacterized protein YecE (DUF72 family)
VTPTAASLPGLYVGTSGFSYPSWRGAFYPAKARPADFLRLYAERLPSVELNNPFYQLPAEEWLARWVEQTPAGFRFAVKMSRRITHHGRLESIPAFCSRVRILGDKLGPMLVQFPPNRPRDDGFLRLFLDLLDPELAYAFEFRHPSWNASGASNRPLLAVDDALAAAGIARVGSLEGGAPFRYLRLREPPYDDDALAAWAERLRPLLEQGVDTYVYFKHEDEPSGPLYAERVLELVGAPEAASPRFRSPPRGNRARGIERGRLAMAEERDPEEALDQIREERQEGEEPTSEEREFLEAERVPLEPDEGADRSDEGRGTPTY